MSEPRLNHLRRNELVQVLRDMMASDKPAEVETWVSRVFMAITQPPEAVIHAAEVLKQWNCYGNSPSGYQSAVRFTPPENGYETIAEIVLAAAYEFDESNKDNSTTPQALVYVPMTFDDLINRVAEARTFIDDEVDGHPAGDQVTSLEIVIDTLIKLRSNYLLVPKDE